MKICITGAAGFIGSRVAKKFVEAGHEVVGLDKLGGSDGVKEIDILTAEKKELSDLLRGCDAVFHLAGCANVNEFMADVPAGVRATTEMTAKMLDAASAARVGSFFFASTVWVYQAAPAQLISGFPTVYGSEYVGFIPQKVEHPYVASKLACEGMLSAYNQHPMPTCSMRYGIPYGPGMRPNLVIAIFANKIARGETISILGDGLQTRNFVYVDDLADAHVLLAQRADQVAGKAIDLDGPAPVSLLEIINALEKVLDKTAKIEHKEAREGDLGSLRLGSRNAEIIGWQPQTRFFDGLVKTLEYLKLS